MTRFPLVLGLVAIATACTGEGTDDEGQDTSTATDSGEGAGGDTGDDLPQPAPLTDLSDGECPDLTQSGETVEFSSNGQDREVIAVLPSQGAADAPLVFMWHPLGADAQTMVDYLDLQSEADSLGVVFVVPEAMPTNWVEWGFMTDGEDDLALFDDMRTCASQELGVDLRRLYSTGMSAGGLWTSFLLMHRSDTLATALVFSGGSEPVVDYASPVDDTPVMLMHGGSTDTWGAGGFTIDFEETTLNFSDSLVEDGHFVVLCDHGRGHNFPLRVASVTETWLFAHSYGEPSPFVDDQSELPDYCGVATGADAR